MVVLEHFARIGFVSTINLFGLEQVKEITTAQYVEAARDRGGSRNKRSGHNRDAVEDNIVRKVIQCQSVTITPRLLSTVTRIETKDVSEGKIKKIHAEGRWCAALGPVPCKILNQGSRDGGQIFDLKIFCVQVK